jgi:hypothetical protein
MAEVREREHVFRLKHPTASQAHFGGSFRDSSRKVTQTRSFVWVANRTDDLLSIRLVRDKEDT